MLDFENKSLMIRKDECVAVNQFVGGKHHNYFKITSLSSTTSSFALNVPLCDISFIYSTLILLLLLLSDKSYHSHLFSPTSFLPVWMHLIYFERCSKVIPKFAWPNIYNFKSNLTSIHKLRFGVCTFQRRVRRIFDYISLEVLLMTNITLNLVCL